mmetsp:Transcript_15960/g.27032  ORF Transcript_15960/g.27032 Transcript_15960/m.27032 type:complete len:178 (-) Transcript_15960:103-636(-)
MSSKQVYQPLQIDAEGTVASTKTTIAPETRAGRWRVCRRILFVTVALMLAGAALVGLVLYKRGNDIPFLRKQSQDQDQPQQAAVQDQGGQYAAVPNPNEDKHLQAPASLKNHKKEEEKHHHGMDGARPGAAVGEHPYEDSHKSEHLETLPHHHDGPGSNHDGKDHHDAEHHDNDNGH